MVARLHPPLTLIPEGGSHEHAEDNQQRPTLRCSPVRRLSNRGSSLPVLDKADVAPRQLALSMAFIFAEA
jgi:hypothetical protein